MYLKHALVLNSGSIRDLEVELQFDDNGNPKPLILVGPNGAGKTNFLSLVADALVEMAAKVFRDVVGQLPRGGHQYFRLLSAKNSRLGSNFELAALKFGDAQHHFHFASKFGDVDNKDWVKGRLSWWNEPMAWVSQDHGKQVYVEKEQIEWIFRDECHVFFPAHRWEQPYWSVENVGNDETVFTDRVSGILGKPILVASALSEMKPWLVDVIFDHMQHLLNVRGISNDDTAKMPRGVRLQNTTLSHFNRLLQTILQIREARLTRGIRTEGSRKLEVHGDEVLFPSLESLSAGQSSLLVIFGTILRYTDPGPDASSTSERRGIVLIDEIDLHLHANLLHDILPDLMALFPKIQFIVTTHSPLVPLGMERKFGEDGIHIMEMPTGRTITAERFGEFRASLAVLEATQAFEEKVADRVMVQDRPLVLCEGETDVKYMRTAAELLGYDKLATEVEWDWVGTLDKGMAKDGGKDRLRQAMIFLRNNQRSLLRRHTLLLFDCDVKAKPFDKERLHVRILPRNEGNQRRRSGIENLLPEGVFEEGFFKERKRDTDVASAPTLDKAKLCKHLCVTTKCPTDFEGFRVALDEIRQVFQL